MDALCSGVSLGRALLALARARRTGVLTIVAPGNACRLAWVDGVPRAASSLHGKDALGDVLLRAGDMDGARHVHALEQGLPEGRVGQWLVATGVASRPAVAQALRLQLRRRVTDALSWQSSSYVFREHAVGHDFACIDEPIAAADLVVSALRGRVPAWLMQSLASAEHIGIFRMSSLGRAFLPDVALWPDEAAMLPLLEQGASLAELRHASAGSERALSMLALFSLLSLVSERSSAPSGLLVRKLAEVRRHAPAHELLDLPAGASRTQAPRALRRLSRALHPDTLGPTASPALQRASTEVMSSLGRAERELRART